MDGMLQRAKYDVHPMLNLTACIYHRLHINREADEFSTIAIVASLTHTRSHTQHKYTIRIVCLYFESNRGIEIYYNHVICACSNGTLYNYFYSGSFALLWVEWIHRMADIHIYIYYIHTYRSQIWSIDFGRSSYMEIMTEFVYFIYPTSPLTIN